MIVYKEFSSLSQDLGFSAKALYGLSHSIRRHYRKVLIPKSGGEFRELSVPDDFLKTVQRRINDILLPLEEISPYAAAYRSGSSPKWNASVHVAKPMLLKLDIRHFFDNIIYPMVKDRAFPAERYSESNRILLTMLCMYRHSLPQGAATSPSISNIIMREFDDTIGGWCRKKNISYSRYCDDMTFSGEFNAAPMIRLVKTELGKLGFFLNDRKTILVRRGQRQSVTGIVVNEKLNVSSDYRRKLRQELYYSMKFGIASHVKTAGIPFGDREYAQKLLGKVNYVLSVAPGNEEMRKYKAWLCTQIKNT